MDIQNYDDNGIYLSTSLADIDPLNEGQYIIPANATTIPIPSYAQNEIPVFDGTSWSIEIDFRGTVYWDDDATKYHITDIGEAPPVWALYSEPVIPLPPPPTLDELYDLELQSFNVLKALIIALNDGTFVPGSNYTAAEGKTRIKSKM